MKTGSYSFVRPVLAAAVLMGCGTSFAKISADQPITAEEFQKELGQGIAASWYKTKFSNKGQGDDLKDFKSRGFDHVRYRVNAEVFSGQGFDRIEDEINRTLREGLIPIISWINHPAESQGTAAQKADYVAWWKDLAKRFKGEYLVGFNLFTEVNDGSAIFSDNLYNPWMKEAVTAIRSVDPHRIIIMSSPNKTQKQLSLIDKNIYRNDDYMMVEWHLYASGPKQDGGQKNWEGNGSKQDRLNVTDPLDEGVEFTEKTGIECYFGAWMPMDNKGGSLTQVEVENFARFFVKECAKRNIPWTVNADQHFYDSKRDKWLGVAKTTARQLDMKPIVDILVANDVPPPDEPPEFNAPVLVKTEAVVGQSYTGSIAGDVTEPDGDPLTFSSVSGPSWLAVAEDGALYGTPTLADKGENSWEVQVSDKDGKDTAMLRIEVTDTNTPPLFVEAGADQTVAAKDASQIATVSLSATGTDGVNDYLWKTNGVVIGTGADLLVDLPVGTHSLMVRLKDGAETVRDTVVVTVTPYVNPSNEPPKFKKSTVLSTKAKSGKAFSKDISGKASDPDNDPLTFSKVSGPDWLQVSAKGKLFGTPDKGDKGNNVFKVAVSDGQASDTATVKVKVK